MLAVKIHQGLIAGIVDVDKLSDDTKAIDAEQVFKIKVGEPLYCYDGNWNRLPDKQLIAEGKLNDQRGWWHDPQTPYWEERGEGHSDAYHAAAEIEITTYNTDPPQGWVKGRHPGALAQEEKEKLKAMAAKAKGKMEQAKAKKIIAKEDVPASIERGIAAATLQAADGLTLHER